MQAVSRSSFFPSDFPKQASRGTQAQGRLRARDRLQAEFAACGDIRKYPQGVALSSNCYGVVVEPWDGRRVGRRQVRTSDVITGRVDPRARLTKSKATMTQPGPLRPCFSTWMGVEGVLRLARMIAAIGFLVAVATTSATAADVSGAGATFPYPIYAKWADAYKKQTGIAVNYQPVGSGEGIKQIENKEVTFGASDMPLKGADLDMHGLVQFPTVIGGVVAVVNVEGIKAGDLTLDGPTLARIFLGEIKSWNDAALRRLNPTVKLPSQPIAVV